MANKQKIGKRIGMMFAILLLLTAAVFNGIRVEEIDESFLKDYGGFDCYERVNKTPLVYAVAMGNETCGYLVFSDCYGYQSTITTATLVGLDAVVKDVQIYQESETPGFINRIYGSTFFPRNFQGQPIADGFSVGDNVDAVSRATVSSTAITKSVQSGVAYVGDHYLDTAVLSHRDGGLIGKTEIAVLIMFVLAIWAAQTKNKALMLIVRVYSVLILGFWLKKFIPLSAFGSMMSLNFPHLYDKLSWYMLVFGALLFIFVMDKNLYCTYICPFGSLQHLEYRFAKLGVFKLHPKVARYLKLLPGCMAYCALLLALSTSNIAATNYEPFSLIFGRTGNGIQWVLLPLVLLAALFVQNFYCRFGCPVGFILGLMVKVRRKAARLLWKKKKSNKTEHDVQNETIQAD